MKKNLMLVVIGLALGFTLAGFSKRDRPENEIKIETPPHVVFAKALAEKHGLDEKKLQLFLAEVDLARDGYFPQELMLELYSEEVLNELRNH